MSFVAIFVDREHVNLGGNSKLTKKTGKEVVTYRLTKQPKVAAEFDGVSNQQPNGRTCKMRSFFWVHDERTRKVTPTVSSAVSC
jgi:hypothetical protein